MSVSQTVQAKGSPDYWPTHGWRVSTPVEQGLAPAPILRMLQWLRSHNKNVQSLLVVRNGYLVLEAYFPPYRADVRHDLYSATKSVTATLVGIALQQGSLKSVTQRVMADFYPERQVSSPDPRRAAITLEHLLEMSSGTAWDETGVSYASRRNPIARLHRSQDWVQFILDQPMSAEPGTRFQYNSGSSHLLSAILQQQTGRPAADFARETLFEPLGFADTYWPADPNGITLGSSGLQLVPRDLAKLGYLYLQDGIWEGERLLPPGWVEAVTRQHQAAVSPEQPRIRLQNFLNRVLRPETPKIPGMNYSYHWWLPSFGGYAARGWSGQALFVLPQLDLVVVFNSGLGGADNFLPDQLIVDFILPAAQRLAGEAVNREGSEQLQSLVASLAAAAPQPVPPLPAAARRVSGRVIHWPRGRGGFQSLELTFGQAEAAGLTVVQGDTTHAVQIGQDGVFRFNPISAAETLALRGGWLDEQTYTIDWRALASGERTQILLTFQGDRVRIRSSSTLTGRVSRMTGELGR
jgi:CubicO group peptidase (beta-lactamase class C family)